MHTPSIRTLAAIAYERGEEFDPALMLSPALAEQLDRTAVAGTSVLESRGRQEVDVSSRMRARTSWSAQP